MLARVGRLVAAIRCFATALTARSGRALTTRSGDRLIGR